MTPKQEAHLAEIIKITSFMLNDKYRRGAEEHGGDLEDLTVTKLLDESLNEALDMVTYILTAQAKLYAIKSKLKLQPL